ncbi:hypothetical protein VOLCADRAFT_104512 [Volvox carteri f. nagariensis]|uniref:Nephrocystin 3-like N-terminal domain-containing protein n=1 Tax=Volvox carteri f. nagariensis TaxID=3068 RepID=D8TU40_VOLCA|nr:uncharacterized protein VOLCADRAFT_104512 [Volvox carteri f. nagariensis]EFJ49075.1 hypothetical protein VOLCADRAFT_104512 [Volvox carteri f. nagariensis]|eukprot:XP_002949972.1 hypothetical protein VOLCADRAFT_104512 [Volvox carteri f. nagariensis]
MGNFWHEVKGDDSIGAYRPPSAQPSVSIRANRLWLEDPDVPRDAYDPHSMFSKYGAPDDGSKTTCHTSAAGSSKREGVLGPASMWGGGGTAIRGNFSGSVPWVTAGWRSGQSSNRTEPAAATAGPERGSLVSRTQSWTGSGSGTRQQRQPGALWALRACGAMRTGAAATAAAPQTPGQTGPRACKRTPSSHAATWGDDPWDGAVGRSVSCGPLCSRAGAPPAVLLLLVLLPVEAATWEGGADLCSLNGGGAATDILGRTSMGGTVGGPLARPPSFGRGTLPPPGPLKLGNGSEVMELEASEWPGGGAAAAAGRTIVTKTVVTRTHSGRIRTEVTTTTSGPAHLINGYGSGGSGGVGSVDEPPTPLSPGVRLAQGSGLRAARSGGSAQTSPTAAAAAAAANGALSSPRRPSIADGVSAPGGGGGGGAAPPSPILTRRPSQTGLLPLRPVSAGRTAPLAASLPGPLQSSQGNAVQAALRNTWGGAGGGGSGGGIAGSAAAAPAAGSAVAAARMSSPARTPVSARNAAAAGGGSGSPGGGPAAGRLRMSPAFAAAHGLGGGGGGGGSSSSGQIDMYNSAGGGGIGQRPASGRYGSAAAAGSLSPPSPASPEYRSLGSASTRLQSLPGGTAGGGGGLESSALLRASGDTTPLRTPQPPPSPKAVAAAKMMGVRRNAGQCAVSLAFLRRFRTRLLRERKDAASLCTSQVVQEVIKPMTASSACRLTDLNLNELVSEADVGPPDYFISHAWSMPFLQLLDCFFNHLQGALDSTRVWLDIFAVNQHPGAEQKDDLENLRTAIALSQATLVCLDARGTPLERVWCLYEFDNTLALKGADALVLLTPGFSIREIASIFSTCVLTYLSMAFNAKLKLRFLLEPLDAKPDMMALAARAGTDASQWNLAPVAEWLAAPHGPQVAVVTAAPGTGKSTITAVLCMGPEAAAEVAAAAAAGSKPERPSTASPTAAAAAERRRSSMMGHRVSTTGGGGSGVTVHAFHFCKYSDARRQDPVRVVKTLAYQLAQSLPELGRYYCGLDPGTLMQLNQPDTACRELLVMPLQQTVAARGQQILMVLDALDEADKAPQPTHCTGASTSSSSPSSSTPSALDNKVLQLLLHQLSLLPSCVRILTTIRPDPHLLGPIRTRFPDLLELTPGELRKQDKTHAVMQHPTTSEWH